MGFWGVPCPACKQILSLTYSKDLKKVKPWYSGKVTNKYRKKIEQFLYELPFEEKKRIIESIVSPEKGMGFLIRYPRISDSMSVHDFTDSNDNEIKNWEEPLSDEEPKVYHDFYFTIDKVKELINSLNKKPIFDKFGGQRARKGQAYRQKPARPFPTDTDILGAGQPQSGCQGCIAGSAQSVQTPCAGHRYGVG